MTRQAPLRLRPAPTLDPRQPPCSQRALRWESPSWTGCGRGKGERAGGGVGCAWRLGALCPTCCPAEEGRGAACPVGTEESAWLRGWGATKFTVTLSWRAWGGRPCPRLCYLQGHRPPTCSRAVAGLWLWASPRANGVGGTPAVCRPFLEGRRDLGGSHSSSC